MAQRPAIGSSYPRHETLRLPSRPEAVSEGRRAVRALARGLEARVRQDAQLVASELLTNAVIHGSDLLGSGIELRLSLEEARLRIEVVDQGAGFGPSVAESGAPGGWGLQIVARLAREWGVANDGNTCVWAALPVAECEPAGAENVVPPLVEHAGTSVAVISAPAA